MKSTRIQLTLILALVFQLKSFATIYTVINTSATGAGSLGQAITDANTNPGKDTIQFSIAGAAPHVINMGGTTLPVVSEIVLIDGTSQTGYTTIPLVEITNSNAQGLNFNANADGAEVRALAITGCAAQGIYCLASQVKIFDCYIGLKTNNTKVANLASGIQIDAGSDDNIIGRNVVSGNGAHGISFLNSDRNVVFGNIIGLTSDGATAMGNGSNGINFSTTCDYNRIGGTSSDSLNVISGNLQHGIEFGNNSRFNQILGNYIGCGSNGTSDLGNTAHGILFTTNSSDNIVGGNGSGSRNVISGNNTHGINVNSCNRITIRSNYIGVTVNGLGALGNTSHAIQLETARDCIVGGDRTTQGNVLSNSGGCGFNDQGGNAKKTIFQGNFVGTNKDGFQNFGNNNIGVIIKSDSCTIGGDSPEFGNIISNTKILCGLLLANASYAKVKYNLIGTYIDSTNAGNKQDGINVGVENAGMFAQNNLIEYNAIAYNQKNGIAIGDALNTTNSTNEINNTVQYNRIFCNTQKGINLNLTVINDRGNNGKAAPAINAALSNDSTLVGLASGLTAGDRIDVYKMTDCVNCDLNPQGKYYVGSTTVNSDGSWTYLPDEAFDGTLVATATDANGNTSEFSLCYTPCKASVTISGAPSLLYLTSNEPQNLTLTANATFSTLTPVPGKIFWMQTTADTLLSISNSTTQTWDASVQGSTLVSGLNTIFVIAKQAGCMDTAKVSIKVLFIPNIITPNGDGKNDAWLLSNTNGLYEVAIFNRWGDRVFEAADYTDEFEASGLSDGSYYYEIVEKDNGERYKGWLQVLK